MAGRRRALIVANGEYDNAGLQQLGSPAADADALAGVLADRTISDFEVRVVRNEASHVVQGEIEDLCAEGRPDDVLLLHFSCHGLKDDAGGLYFAARNTRPDRLRSTAVPADFVQQCIRQSRSRSIVLLLDCCYGGAFGQGVAVRASGDANVLDSFRGGRGRAVITASNSIEYAFEGAALASDGPARPSVFTSALVEGLRTGEADRDEDGWIALGELYEYLFDRVRERNPKQTPSRDIEMQGELYLAKSRRRRIKPSPIPPDLAAAIGAENPFTRLGAVAELRRRLSSGNLPVAMGAFEALRSMAATDIEHVAAAASEAMGFAVVRVEPSVVRLSAAAGSVASAALRAVGPPVAREVRFEASHAWIEVAETASGASLSVAAGPAGVRRGKVVVTGPTGDVVVEVEIEAEPEPVIAPEPDGESAGESESDREPVAEQGQSAESEPMAGSARAGEAVAGVERAGEAAAGVERAGEAAAGVERGGEAAAGPERAGEAASGPERAGEAAAAAERGGEAAAGPELAGEAAAGPELAGELIPEPRPEQATAPEAVTEPAPAAELVPEPRPKPPESGASGPVVKSPGPVAGHREPAAVAPEPAEDSPAASEAAEKPATGARETAADPVAGTAAILAIGGAVFAVSGMGLNYRYDEYNLASYRPGMPVYVGVVAACALLAGILTLVPRTRRRVGPALVLGTGFAASFGFLRFLGEFVTLSQHSSTNLNAGFAFELIAHTGLVVAGGCALAALRRSSAASFGKPRRWEAWTAIVLGAGIAAGWITQLSELAVYDDSDAGRAAAYYVLGALLALALPVFAAALRPRRAAVAVLAAGTLGLAGVLGPTFAPLFYDSSLTVAGQVIATVGLVLLGALVVVWGIRNQPNGRQP
ncbi:caspase, EACC1-associated type [Amycolatopsis sp. NPDC004378]